MMRLFLIGLCVLNLSVSTQAEDNRPVDPSGTWRWESDVNGTIIESRLKLAFNGTSLTGTYDDQNLDVEISDGSVDGNSVSFGFTVDYEGQELELMFSGEVQDDEIAGFVRIADVGTYDWLAKRATEPADVVGDWELEIVTPEGQVLSPTLRLTYNKPEFGGVYDSPLAGELPLSDVQLKENELRFTVRADIGQEIVLNFQGTPRGSRLAGEVSYDFGGQTGTLEFSGSKKMPKRRKAENRRDEQPAGSE